MALGNFITIVGLYGYRKVVLVDWFAGDVYMFIGLAILGLSLRTLAINIRIIYYVGLGRCFGIA